MATLIHLLQYGRQYSSARGKPELCEKENATCGASNLRRTNLIPRVTGPGGIESGMVAVGFLMHHNKSPTNHRVCQHDHISSFQTFFYIDQLLFLTSENQKHQEGTGWFQITVLS